MLAASSTGYYHTGGLCFSSKIDAIIYKQASKASDFRWDYNDALYDRYDWTIEPQEDIKELYKQRAIDLRNRYDYLILHYTGGHDSQNVLETFALNGIHLDEIFMRGSRLDKVDPNDPSPSNLNAELTHVALPIAREIKEKYLPHTKITLIDHQQDTLNFWKNAKNIHEKQIFISDPAHFMRFDYANVNLNLRQARKKGCKIAHITGHDKPYLGKDENRYFFRFVDDPVFRYVRNDGLLARENEDTVEFFYWHPNAAKLIIKQCHMLKHFIDQIPKYQHNDVFLLRSIEDQIARIIYDRKYYIPLAMPKTGTWLIDPTVQWFVQERSDTHYRHYAKHIWEWNKSIPREFGRNNNFLDYGLAPHFSKKYYITVD